MQIDVFVHFQHDKLEGMAALLQREFAANRTQLTNLKGLMMANQAELTAKLTAIADRAEKVKAEILAALEKLKATATTPEQDAALARLETAVGGMDDLNADAAPTPA